MSDRRVIFDLTSSANWTGPQTGIVRVQRELARWASANAPDTLFAVFDPRSGRYAHIAPAYVDAFINGTAVLDAWGLPDPTGRLRPRRGRWLPAPVYSALRIRRMTLRALERVRLTSEVPTLTAVADRVQRRLMTERTGPYMINEDGSRRAQPTPDIALGDTIDFGPKDVLVCAGNGWSDCDIAAVARRKADTGFRLVVLCYDVIALQFPGYFKPEDVEAMSGYWRACFPTADLVVFNSRAAAADARAWCRSVGIVLRQTAVTPLGSDPSPMTARSDAVLPAGLEEGRYALFVSTIEPRKGHELLYRVWLRLLDEQIPQAHRFKLVFVGRVGWQMEAFERTLVADGRLAGSLIRLSGIGDEALDLLYRRAAFCVYPSLNEGYGLPVVEAFARGKPLLASDGGSLPEVVREFSPILPARDQDAWHAAMRAWIMRPAAYAKFEKVIRERFTHPNWNEASLRFFGLLEQAFEG